MLHVTCQLSLTAKAAGKHRHVCLGEPAYLSTSPKIIQNTKVHPNCSTNKLSSVAELSICYSTKVSSPPGSRVSRRGQTHSRTSPLRLNWPRV